MRVCVTHTLDFNAYGLSKSNGTIFNWHKWIYVNSNRQLPENSIAFMLHIKGTFMLYISCCPFFINFSKKFVLLVLAFFFSLVYVSNANLIRLKTLKMEMFVESLHLDFSLFFFFWFYWKISTSWYAWHRNIYKICTWIHPKSIELWAIIWLIPANRFIDGHFVRRAIHHECAHYFSFSCRKE